MILMNYEEATSLLQGFIDEAYEVGISDPMNRCFMHVWRGPDARTLVNADEAVELVGFLPEFGMDNEYTSMEVALQLALEYGIAFNEA